MSLVLYTKPKQKTPKTSFLSAVRVSIHIQADIPFCQHRLSSPAKSAEGTLHEMSISCLSVLGFAPWQRGLQEAGLFLADAAKGRQ